MSLFSRRKLITTGLAGAAGGFGARHRSQTCSALWTSFRPMAAGFYGPGETLSYAAQRLVVRQSLAREFTSGQISKAPYANGIETGEACHAAAECGFHHRLAPQGRRNGCTPGFVSRLGS